MVQLSAVTPFPLALALAGAPLLSNLVAGELGLLLWVGGMWGWMIAGRLLASGFFGLPGVGFWGSSMHLDGKR